MLVAGCWLVAGCLVVPEPSDDDDDDASPFDAALLPQGDPPIHDPMRGEVRRIIDGDTAEMLVEGGSIETIRFLSVNTPELHVEDGPPECYAQAATDHLAEVLPEGTEVWLTFDGEFEDTYDRLLAYVFVGDNPSVDDFSDWVNLAIVEQGFGVAFIWENNQTWGDLFRDAEATAREAEVGMWRYCD